MAERYPAPSHLELETINAILSRVTISKREVPIFAPQDWETAKHLSKRLTGYLPTSSCSSCQRTLHDKLRTLAGLTYARTPLAHDRVAARKAICHACPAYHPSTDSCGRLILDAVSSHPVMIEGKAVHPCGCIITLKAMFRSETCPGNFWPSK